MNKKDLLIFIFIDFAVIAAVLFNFYYFDKKVAGLIGGALFLAQGFYILIKISKWDKFSSSASLYGTMAHLFLATIPVLVIRLAFWSTEFSHIQLGFITGPGLHKFAETIYLILIVSHIIDLLKVQFKKQPKTI